MMVDVKVAGGGSVAATDGHPFWNATTREWARANHLKAGQELLTSSGATLGLTSAVVYSDVLTAYNLTVTDLHTYYVVAESTPVLVHNCPPGGWDLPGVGDMPTKVVNSNMGHIDDERAMRAGYASRREATDAVRDLGRDIEANGFPEGTIADSARNDRLLVPLGSNGLAAYQVKPNGNAVFKTILTAR